MKRASPCRDFALCALAAMSAALGVACSDGAGGGSGGGSAAGSASGSSGSMSASSGAGGGSASSSSGGSSSGSSGSSSSGSSSSSSGGSSLSDTFDAASLDAAWQIINPGAVAVKLSAGSLELTLTKPALWFQASQGVLVYKTVTGDFKATSRVHARRTSAPASPPVGPVELGGLMARSPAGPPENYVFIVVGADENDISVETKSTVDSVSTYVGPAWPSASAELRLCRVGADFVMLKRAIGGASWIEAQKSARPDLPAALQVGPNIYSLNQPDLTVVVDEVIFASVAGLADCAVD